MILINKAYLDRFKKMNHEYIYTVSKGIYLAFDDEDLSYIGIEMFYLPYNHIEVEKQCELVLNELLSKGILESR